MVDGAPSTAVYRPLVHQDATYVPLRPVAELFESEVGWDGDRSKASVIDGEREGFVYVWRNHPASRISGVFRDGWRLQADTFKRRADREQGATVTIDRVDDYSPYILVAAWNRAAAGRLQRYANAISEPLSRLLPDLIYLKTKKGRFDDLIARVSAVYWTAGGFKNARVARYDYDEPADPLGLAMHWHQRLAGRTRAGGAYHLSITARTAEQLDETMAFLATLQFGAPDY